MGVRFASLRQSDVVMAPALTDATQSQNFKLPSTHSSPLSPIGVAFNGNKIVSPPKLLSDSAIHKVPVTNFEDCISSESEKTTPRVNGTRTSFMKYPIDVKSLAYDNLNTLAIASELLKNCRDTVESTQNVFGEDKGEKGYPIMNYSDPSMGDNYDKMGFQKSSTALRPSAGGRSRRAESGLNSLEHQIKICDTNLAQSSQRAEIGSCSILDKPFEIPFVEKDLLEDSIIFDTEAEGSYLESNSTFQKPSCVDDSFENEFLNSVDVMEICAEDTFDAKLFGLDSKESVSTDNTEISRKKNQESHRISEGLSKRIKMFQAKVMVASAQRQVKNFVSHTQNMKQSNSLTESNSGEGSSAPPRNECGSESSSVVQNEKKSKFPSLSNLFKSVDNTSQVPSPSSKSVYGKSSVASAEQTTPASGSQLNLEPQVLQEVITVSGELQAQLKLVQEELDSEATASSSGGESCDEFLSSEKNEPILPIEKRAIWRYAQQRARLASRWTWLQAQISDLEYRIRQNNDIHRQIKMSKEPVLLGEVVCPPMVLNGYHGAGGSADEWCARVRPLERRPLAKRKLLHVQGLHAANKRAARPSSVRCACRPPASLCALCSGRSDPTRPRAPPHHLTAAERAAAADPAYHPVLSMLHEVKESIHYEGIMKTTEWQQKTLRSSLKSMKAAGLPKFEKDAAVEGRGKKQTVEPKRKYTSRLKKNTANNATTKTKRKQTKGRKPKNTETDNPTVPRVRRRRNGQKAGSYIGCDDGGDGHEASSSISKQTSPVASPGPSSSALEKPAGQVASRLTSGEASRRKRENSYDIDNVVIPSSLSSAARHEKIQYKEIPTPKWRPVENDFIVWPKFDLRNNGVIRRSSQENDDEDISDDTIALRHDRCEMEEKKKFMSYMKLPYSGRSRANRRIDSRAESSGANSPDPMSPNPEYHEGVSPVMSPLAAALDHDQSAYTSTRRRTVSSSRWYRDDLRISTTDPVAEMAPPKVPYEPRKFPLSDDMYDRMLRCMPNGHPYPPPIDEPKKSFTKDFDFNESRPDSPSTDSTESAIGEEDLDPNDPEWTVEDEREYERDRVKSYVKR